MKHIDTNLHIQVLVSENPRRKGSLGYTSFNIYRKNMTVAKHREKGGRSNDLRWDVAHGYIKLTKKPSDK